jgi:hypothetical protein
MNPDFARKCQDYYKTHDAETYLVEWRPKQSQEKSIGGDYLSKVLARTHTSLCLETKSDSYHLWKSANIDKKSADQPDVVRSGPDGLLHYPANCHFCKKQGCVRRPIAI